MNEVAQEEWFHEMRQRYLQSPIHDLLGLELSEIDSGSVTIILKALPTGRNAMGSVHGGVLTSTIDSALLQSVRTRTGPGDRLTTLELKVNFMRPANGSEFRCHGRTLHVGRTMGVSTAQIEDEEGRIVAAGQGSIFIKRPS